MSKPEAPREHRLNHQDVGLNILALGRERDPCVVMVHGLRDTAWSLLPIANHLTDAKHRQTYRVLITELRGHGASDRSEAYALPNFLLDLHHAVTEFNAGPCALFGHSLGGHIVTKYAALFPEIVRAMLVVEGLGPPRRPHEGNEAAEIAAYRMALLARLSPRPTRRNPIQGADDVAARLCRNNPRLAPDQAAAFAGHLISTTEDGYDWAFDPRASSVFIGSSTHDNERWWRQVQSPTCVISGALSYEYWGREMPQEDFSGHFAEGELEARAALIPHHEHHWFEHSGHMVHYDEPERLGRLCRTFLEQHYV